MSPGYRLQDSYCKAGCHLSLDKRGRSPTSVPSVSSEKSKCTQITHISFKVPAQQALPCRQPFRTYSYMSQTFTPSSACTTHYPAFPDLILTTALSVSCCHHAHFADEKTETWKVRSLAQSTESISGRYGLNPVPDWRARTFHPCV